MKKKIFASIATVTLLCSTGNFIEIVQADSIKNQLPKSNTQFLAPSLLGNSMEKEGGVIDPVQEGDYEVSGKTQPNIKLGVLWTRGSAAMDYVEIESNADGYYWYTFSNPVAEGDLIRLTQILDNGEQVRLGSYIADPVSLDLLKGWGHDINYSQYILSPPKANHLVNGGYTTYETTIIELKVNTNIQNPGIYGQARTVRLMTWDGTTIKEAPIDSETEIARIEVPQGKINPFTLIYVCGVTDDGREWEAPTFYIGD